MSKKAHLRKACSKVKEETWTIEIREKAFGKFDVVIPEVNPLEADEEILDQSRALSEAYESLITDIERIEQQELSQLEESWRVGQAIAEATGTEWTPSSFPNQQVVKQYTDIGDTRLSNCKRIYEAFPDKPFADEHTASDVRPFATRATSDERGRLGYKRYKKHDLDIPAKTLRAWTSSTDESIEGLAERTVEHSQTTTVETLATHLQSLCKLCDDTERPSDEEAQELIRKAL